MSLAEHGIIPSCQRHFCNRLGKQLCADLTMEEIKGSFAIRWKRYVRALIVSYHDKFTRASILRGASNSGNKTHYMLLTKMIEDGMMKKGCEFVRELNYYPVLSAQGRRETIDLCDVVHRGIPQGRSVRTFCPISCGCDSKIAEYNQKSGNLNWGTDLAWESQCPRKCLNLTKAECS